MEISGKTRGGCVDAAASASIKITPFRASWRFWLEYLGRDLPMVFLAALVISALLGCCLIAAGKPIVYDLQVILDSVVDAVMNQPAKHIIEGILMYAVCTAWCMMCAFLFYRLGSLVVSIVSGLLRFKAQYTIDDRQCVASGHFFARYNHQFACAQLVGWTTKQSRFGRWLDYGTVIWRLANGKSYRWCRIGQFKRFRAEALLRLEHVLEDKACAHAHVAEISYHARPRAQAVISFLFSLLWIIFGFAVVICLGCFLCVVADIHVPMAIAIFVDYLFFALFYLGMRLMRLAGVEYRIARGLCVSSWNFGRRLEECFLLSYVTKVKARRGLGSLFFDYGNIKWQLGHKRGVKWRIVPQFKKLRAQLLQHSGRSQV